MQRQRGSTSVTAYSDIGAAPATGGSDKRAAPATEYSDMGAAPATGGSDTLAATATASPPLFRQISVDRVVHWAMGNGIFGDGEWGEYQTSPRFRAKSRHHSANIAA